MSRILATYSAKDVNFTFTHPLTGPIQAAGIAEMGLAQITIRRTVTQSVLQVAMDGAVVPSVVPGDQGEIEIQVWQTSDLHQQFMAWYNAIKAARDAGDVTNWFAGKIMIQCILDGTQHILSGVAPAKFGDIPYQEQAQRITWPLVACDIVSQ